MRIFAGIDISDDARMTVASHIERLRDAYRNLRVGWEKPEKLHITLKFFGDVETRRVVDLQRSLDGLASRHSSFTAELSGTGVFPNGQKPRVLWVGIQNDGGAMTVLGGEIERQSRNAGLPAENRAFNPHLTIARLREPEKSRELAEKHLGTQFDTVRFEVKELVLYESKLLPSGSVYSVVSRSMLS